MYAPMRGILIQATVIDLQPFYLIDQAQNLILILQQNLILYLQPGL